MGDGAVTYVLDEGIATITLDRPLKINALNRRMLAGLTSGIERAETDPAVTAVVLRGAGRGFCSGQDLSDRYIEPGVPAPDLGESLDQRYNPLIRSIRLSTKPIIAAVHGVAAGAGANLAFACHFVVAADDARFIEVFATVGLIPDCGGTWHLIHNAGRARALGLALLARPIDGATAAQWGLATVAVPEDAVVATALAMARRAAEEG
ncbi:MAG: hypothetical protein BMS9Abin07_2150 [Acidimicrobiia bacterium]|nr:MAG: hypothetical protein BMS9Abin07_2150 [Acidimicrobiia bacterium]